MTACYLHCEDVQPEFTLKFGIGGQPLSVSEALGRFALAYGSTGYDLNPAALELVDEAGTSLSPDAVLPCGLPDGSDAFVRSSEAPVPQASSGAAAAAAKAAMAAAAHPAAAKTAAAAALGAVQSKGVYAAPGSAIAASQAKMGENSYYYSVGKNKAVTPAVPVAPRQPKAVVTKSQALPEVTISSYSHLDDDKAIKVHVPLAGAGSLPEGAIVTVFRERSFDLKVTQDGKILRLHIPILGEEVVPEKCLVKKKAGKLIIHLAKKDESKGWHELRKTKGVGDSEYNKLSPDGGDPTEFIL